MNPHPQATLRRTPYEDLVRGRRQVDELRYRLAQAEDARWAASREGEDG